MYEVSTPKDVIPTIKIVGYDDDYMTDQNLIDALKCENSSIFDEESVIKIVSNKKNRANRCVAEINVDVDTLQKCLAKKRAIIGFISCRIYEQIEVVRCFKCCRFGHIAADCTEKSYICPVCAGAHMVGECNSTVHKCANCVDAAERFNFVGDVNHSALSMTCPMMIKRIEKRKKNIVYKQ